MPAPDIGGNFTYDTGPAGFDIPHLFGDELRRRAAVRQWQAVPRRTRERSRTASLGGWQAQSIVNYRSGLPFTPTVSRDVANTGSGGQRPNQIGSGKLENPTIDAWFDRTAFVVPPDFTFGNTARGILRGDHQWNVDFSLFKRFSVAGSKTLEFRAEAFNLLNSVLLRSAEHRDRYGDCRPYNRHVECGENAPVRLEVPLLTLLGCWLRTSGFGPGVRSMSPICVLIPVIISR